jgi:hypothetical protein
MALPKKAVYLSSIGAEQASGLGIITGSHLLEQTLGDRSADRPCIPEGRLVYGEPRRRTEYAQRSYKAFQTPIPKRLFSLPRHRWIRHSAWLMQRREDANHRQARFGEPVPPPPFVFAGSSNLGQLLAVYKADDVFAHNEIMRLLLSRFGSLGLRERLRFAGLVPLSDAEVNFLLPHLSDAAGPYAAVAELL